MHRSDKEVRDPVWIETVLTEAPFCHIALCILDHPYVIPMNFVFFEGCLILHSALEGEKIRIIQQNPRISFAAEVGVELIPDKNPCRYSMRYKSVCGHGDARFVEESDRKMKLLSILAAKYMSGLIPSFVPDVLLHMVVIEVKILGMVGKKSGYQDS